MSANKSTGYADKAAGVLKETAGKVFSSDLEARGATQKNKGQAEINGAKLQNRGEAAVNKTGGVVEQTLGDLTGSTELKRGGGQKLIRADATDASNQF